MNWPGQILRRVQMLFWRKRFDPELGEEMRLHRDLREREIRELSQRRVGSPTDQAQHAAQRRFGNELQLRERSLDMWGWNWLQDFIQDVRFGARVLRKNPGFTTVTVLSLALGIGANTTIFSIINALTLRSLPVRNPEELVLFATAKSAHDTLFSYAAFTEFRNQASSFSGVLAVCHVDRYNVAINPPEGGAPEWESGVLSVSLTSSNYFSLLGVRPALGRMFVDDEDRASRNNPVVIISYDYWKRRFARSTGVLGRTLSLDGTKFTIIGVAPKGFIGEWVGRPSDLWFPLSMVGEVAGWPRALERPNSTWLRIFGRLNPGITPQRADAATDALWRQIQEVNIGSNPSPQALRRMAEERLVLSAVGTGFSPQRDSLGRPLLILMGVTGLVLLMACANTANLLLARSSARSKEIGLRLAIGAGRGRIVRQLLTESMLLAVLGGAAGLLFTSWGMTAVVRTLSATPVVMRVNEVTIPSAVSLEIHPDAAIFVFAMALCLITGVLFGIAPSFRASGISASTAIKGQSKSGRSLSFFGLGKALVVSQVVISLILVTGAGLFVRTLRNLKVQDYGFNRDHLLLVWTSPDGSGLHGPALTDVFTRAEEKLSLLPGVRSVSATSYGLLGGPSNSDFYRVTFQGYTPQEGEEAVPFVAYNMVSPTFIQAAGLHLVKGRGFTDLDTASAPKVAIIDETMAHHYFGDQDPIGRRLRIKRDAGFPVEVVGLVEDAKYVTVRGKHPFERTGTMYLPYLQDRYDIVPAMCMVVRTAGDPPGIRTAIEKEMRSVDPTLPVLSIVSVDEQIERSLVQERLLAGLAGVSGIIALVLASLGLYGLMAYIMARRTGEIGIRMALGAQRIDVLGMALKESLLVVIVGVAIGVAATLGVTRLIASFLYGITDGDPLTITVATLLMLSVAALAGFLPAYRASRVDPMVALRHE